MTKSVSCLSAVLIGVASSVSGAPSQVELLERLAADYKALERATAAFHGVAASAGERERSDYETFLAGLREHVLEDCLALAEAGYLGLTDDPRCNLLPSGPSPVVAMPQIDTEQTPTERVAALDAELSSSIGDFDEMLLEEERKVKAQRPSTESYGGDAGAGHGESGADGVDGHQEPLENGETGPGDPKSGEEEVAGQDSQMPKGDSEDPAGKGGDQRRAAASAPEDIPDGSDDDVVARQLREAAEKETDPELRAKLWEEYRKYKQGGG